MRWKPGLHPASIPHTRTRLMLPSFVGRLAEAEHEQQLDNERQERT
jgi:hypothetical protein